MALTNKERIGRSVELLRTALVPEVRLSLEQAYGDEWLSHVRSAVRHGEPSAGSLEDVSALLTVVLREWEPVFRARFTQLDPSVVRRARDVRNEWAHRPQEEFTQEHASELLDLIAQILDAIGHETDAMLVRFETGLVANAAVAEPDRRLRAILIDTAAQGASFGVAVTRSKRLGLSREEVALATKALRASQLLAFEDPLTDGSSIHLAG